MKKNIIPCKSIGSSNREYFKGLTETMGSIYQILGFSFFTMLLSFFVMVFANRAGESLRILINETNLFLITEFMLSISIGLVFLFVFPATRYYMYKYQRKMSMLVPLSLLLVVLSASSFVCLIALILKDNEGEFTKLDFENLIMLYTLITTVVLIASFIYGVLRFNKKLSLGYSEVDTLTNYRYKKRPNRGGYLIFIGMSSIVGGLTQSLQLMALISVNAFLLIYSGKYIVELVYLAYLRNTDEYFHEKSMDKPDMKRIIADRLGKFSTYTWIAFILMLVAIGRGLISTLDVDSYFDQMSKLEMMMFLGPQVWLLYIAPSWWVLKKIFASVFKKKEN